MQASVDAAHGGVAKAGAQDKAATIPSEREEQNKALFSRSSSQMLPLAARALPTATASRDCTKS
jgi:hypothetical protein